ncbi:MAG TPA: hypothetical protein VFB29_12305 [Pseudolabrys sp.]|nr:hypothetical protein [Pseudolabrys sp.]
MEQTKKAADATRSKFSPELEAHGRHLFEETDATLAYIASELGIHKTTVSAVAERLGWKRYVPPPRDISPATRILLEAEAFERRRENVQAGAEQGIAAQPDVVGNDPAPADLVPRLQRAVLNELAVVESLRNRLKNDPQTPVEAERTARTLSTLTETLQKLQRMQCALPENTLADDDMPADINAFRLDLARRIDAFVASRIDNGDGEGSGSTKAADPVQP